MIHFIGMINEIDNIEQDVMVKFMHPNSPFIKNFWPSREDECWILIANIICTIDTPVTTTGRILSVTVNSSK